MVDGDGPLEEAYSRLRAATRARFIWRGPDHPRGPSRVQHHSPTVLAAGRRNCRECKKKSSAECAWHIDLTVYRHPAHLWPTCARGFPTGTRRGISIPVGIQLKPQCASCLKDNPHFPPFPHLRTLPDRLPSGSAKLRVATSNDVEVFFHGSRSPEPCRSSSTGE